MSADKKHIASQLQRLMGKAFPPDSPAALGEVVATLARLGEDDEHVTRIIDHLLTVPGPFPEPAVFAQAGDATATLEYMADPECSACDGSGFRVQTVSGYSGAEKCDCWARRPKSLRWWAGEGAHA